MNSNNTDNMVIGTHRINDLPVLVDLLTLLLTLTRHLGGSPNLVIPGVTRVIRAVVASLGPWFETATAWPKP